MNKTILAAALLAISTLLAGCSDDDESAIVTSETHTTPFAYTGYAGPAFWDELSSDNGECAMGNQQSPINLSSGTADAGLQSLDLDLHSTAIHMINNGHTLELEYHDGSYLTLAGAKYELLQFHFHTLSEHAVDGEHAEMELHAVFKNADSGKLAVIGQLYDLGEPNTFLANLVDHLPMTTGQTKELETKVNLMDGLTSTAGYYRYEGSLTTPPCSPIVTWTVLKEHATLSQAQLDSFRMIMGNNFRPLQPLGGRNVLMTP